MSLRVDTVPLGPVSAEARTFTRRDERRLVAVVKVTCELVPDGAMRVLAPGPVTESDVALRVPHPQVVVIGASHAPPGMGVRVAIARGDVMLLDKRADVPAGQPAGLGPLPPGAPVRRARLGSASEDSLLRAFDVALPDDLDDAWFQVVPPDQCLRGALLGGELIALVHLHPTIATLRTHLPPGSAVALLQTDRGARLPIRLRLDTVTLRPETLRAELLWRGDARVDDEALRAARLGAAHGRTETDFPDLATLPVASPARRGPVFAGAAGPSAPAAPAVVEPQRAGRRNRDATMILEVPGAAPVAVVGGRRSRGGTMVLESDSPPPHRAAVAAEDEDEASPSTVVMGQPARGPADERFEDEDTVDGTSGAPPRSMPFERTRTIPPPDAARRGPVPGAPWSPQQARRAPRARREESSTLVLEVERPREPGAVEAPAGAAPPVAVVEPVAPPAASPAPAPAPAPDPPAGTTSPWRSDPPQGAGDAPPAPTAGRAPRARVSFKSDLYRKFKK